MKSFNTRAFRRERPDNPELMAEIISETIVRNEPVSFILYWGKGPRMHAGAPETACLDYLAGLFARIGRIYAPGCRVTLIFTDTHAALNGHSEQSARSYFDDVTTSAHGRGFHTCFLSSLMQTNDPSAGVSEASMPPELFQLLCASARKWYRGGETVEQGALRYYQSNMLEKRAVERAFPRSIVITFGSSKLRDLLPNHLPVFYMYSLRHGVCDKPWFLPSGPPSRDEPDAALDHTAADGS